MITVTFNAFSFLQKKLLQKGIECRNRELVLETGTCASDLIEQMALGAEEVEAVFINGKVVSRETVLRHQDRVALVPPGTPGPYRVFLGFIKGKNIG
ncbi:MAG: MoaD/ThiS family protein [Desulfarculaceae bacterium]|nr:MoaD/ThiS family protein [Desulfarculaceae bacterium]